MKEEENLNFNVLLLKKSNIMQHSFFRTGPSRNIVRKRCARMPSDRSRRTDADSSRALPVSKHNQLILGRIRNALTHLIFLKIKFKT